MRLPDGRWHPKAIAGVGAAKGYVFTWTGLIPKWLPAAASGLAIVDDDEPASPPTGQLWYDTDATC